MADWDVSVKNGRVFITPTTTDEEEAALSAAYANDPTKSKSRYYNFRRTILGKDAPDSTAALEAAGYRRGKSHWCGGDRVIYSIAEWERWDQANPEACTNLTEVEQPVEPEPEPEPKPMPIETHQWAKVPESVAYADLDATAMRVLIILAAKAGQHRTAWIAQQTVADRLGVGRTTIGMAIGRLQKLDLVRKSGRVVVDKNRGTWVQKYNVAPYLPVVTPRVDIGSQAEAPDVNGEAPDVNSVLPDVNFRGPDVADQARLATHSVPIDQSLSISPSASAEAIRKEKQEPPQDRAEEVKQESPAFDAKEWMAQRERRLGRRRGLVLDDPVPDPRTSAGASEARVGEDV